jgi:hypothetical protein
MSVSLADSDEESPTDDVADHNEEDGVETEDTLLLMPIHQRDPRLMSDYIRLPTLV